MKRVLTIAFAFLFSFVMASVAQTSSTSQSSGSTAQSNDKAMSQDTSKQDKKVAKAENKEAKAAEKGKDIGLTGWVKDEGGKTVFENDKDKQTWTISNPDAVKGHEGHHVKVKAKVDEANHSLTIDKLTMMRASKQSGGKHKSKS